jgi:protein-S-isoprenylcysteine O-methyltransferase Ste14
VTQQQLDLLAGVSIVVCWCAFIATWLVAENYNVGRAPEERTRSWFGTAVTPALVIVVVVNLAVPKADWRSLTFYAPPVRILGLAMLLAATAFTIWARLALGTMWSGEPAVKQGHQLRTSGPYGVTRHPIYTGMLGMLLGCLLVSGGGRWIVPFPVFLVLLEIKLHIEERLMQAEFPDDYPRYRQQVPQLVPGLKLISRHRIAIG